MSMYRVFCWIDSRNLEMDALSITECIFLKIYIGSLLQAILSMNPLQWLFLLNFSENVVLQGGDVVGV